MVYLLSVSVWLHFDFFFCWNFGNPGNAKRVSLAVIKSRSHNISLTSSNLNGWPWNCLNSILHTAKKYPCHDIDGFLESIVIPDQLEQKETKQVSSEEADPCHSEQNHRLCMAKKQKFMCCVISNLIKHQFEISLLSWIPENGQKERFIWINFGWPGKVSNHC